MPITVGQARGVCYLGFGRLLGDGFSVGAMLVRAIRDNPHLELGKRPLGELLRASTLDRVGGRFVIDLGPVEGVVRVPVTGGGSNVVEAT